MKSNNENEVQDARINFCGTKKLSFAGWLQLLTLVLYSIQVYWSNIFILPNKVIKPIEQKFSRFPWSGSNNSFTELLGIQCVTEWGRFRAKESWGLEEGNNDEAYMESFCSSWLNLGGLDKWKSAKRKTFG